MATTKRALRKRWKEGDGPRIAAEVTRAIQQRVPIEQLHALVRALPFAEEVAPALDLRGLDLESNIPMLELQGARLDYLKLGGWILTSNLTGAVLDGIEAKNASMRGDFTRASFVGAKLPGASFSRAILREARFDGADLRSARFHEADCRGASFRGANLRFSMPVDTDLRGADLSGADLTESSMGGARVDETTIFRDTDLTGAALEEELRRFAERGGAKLGASVGAYDLAVYDETMAVLSKQNEGGRLDRVLARLRELRADVERDASFDWGSVLSRELSPDVMDEIEAALLRAAKDV